MHFQAITRDKMEGGNFLRAKIAKKFRAWREVKFLPPYISGAGNISDDAYVIAVDATELCAWHRLLSS